MKLNLKFEKNAPAVKLNIAENEPIFTASFRELYIVERTDIPKEYGLITYTQDRIITVT